MDDDMIELQAAIAGCGILDMVEGANGRMAAVMKQPYETRRQRGRPKKKRPRKQANRECLVSLPFMQGLSLSQHAQEISSQLISTVGMRKKFTKMMADVRSFMPVFFQYLVNS